MDIFKCILNLHLFGPVINIRPNTHTFLATFNTRGFFQLIRRKIATILNTDMILNHLDTVNNLEFKNSAEKPLLKSCFWIYLDIFSYFLLYCGFNDIINKFYSNIYCKFVLKWSCLRVEWPWFQLVFILMLRNYTFFDIFLCVVI